MGNLPKLDQGSVGSSEKGQPEADRPSRGRGRSRRLDRGKIVAAAVEVARRDGLKKLSMRRVASNLEVDPAALYWHFQSKDELLGAINRAGAEAADLSIPAFGSLRLCCQTWRFATTSPNSIQ